ncbi:amino acid ABC transporter substrate-binding protein [Candidatus Ichthyocystis hellenicum]|uniref:amino acid ABC transporter substrate-binding protein n=1 Tax=Candidatus Ichthyocystis hellenicum TaxID=1561003 RepID=UPI000B856CDA|nr:amino acid ABC transporter substrate-binding protein [Candidatus Ichthyocystis hellenicum]
MTFIFTKLSKFKKIFFILLIIFIYSIDSWADESTLDNILRTHTLIIGYRTSSIPFSYLNDKQKAIGYSIDLCQEVAMAIKNKLGLSKLNLKFVPITSQNRIVLLQSGTIDIDCGSTSNLKSRRRQVDFSNSIFLAHTKMMVKSGSSIQDFKTVGNKVVVVSSGTSSDNTLAQFARKNNLSFNIIYGKDHANSFLLLMTGRASAFVNDDSILYGLRARIRGRASKFVVLPESLKSEPYALMLRKNDPKFKKVVDDALRNVMESGNIILLYRKWFMSPVPPNGINVSMPLSEDTKELFNHPNDVSADG